MALVTQGHSDTDFSSLYLYGQIELTPTLSVTAGGSFEAVNSTSSDTEQLNPKLGLIWEPTTQTTIRVGAARTLLRPQLSKQNIEPVLEPTGLAGFTQFFFGTTGESAHRAGVAIDHEISSRLHTGAELSRRDLEVPFSIIVPPSPERVRRLLDIREVSNRAYLYWSPRSDLSFTTELQYDRTDNQGVIFAEGFSELRTTRAPLGIRHFSPRGFTTALTATYVNQQGSFGGNFAGPLDPIEPGRDKFWVVDLGASYRLPQRRGTISLKVHNALNKTFRFQDLDPENPRIFPERFVSLQFTLAYNSR